MAAVCGEAEQHDGCFMKVSPEEEARLEEEAEELGKEVEEEVREQEARLERQHFWKVIDAFRYYRDHVQEQVTRAERHFLGLQPRHQMLLPAVLPNLALIGRCVEHNQEVLQAIVRNCKHMFENMEYGEEDDLRKVRPPSTFDMDNLKSTIKQFVTGARRARPRGTPATSLSSRRSRDSSLPTDSQRAGSGGGAGPAGLGDRPSGIRLPGQRVELLHAVLLQLCAQQFTMMQGAVLVWILSALVCLGTGHRHKGHKGGTHTHHKESVLTDYAGGHQDDHAANSLSEVTSANKGFAFNLYRQLVAQTDNQGKNVFFSPSSITLALAALSVGARGQTHQQLFSGLGFNSSVLNQADVNQAFRGLLTAAGKTSSEDVSAGTAVFVDDKFKTHPEFLQTLSQSYLADGFTVDFRNATESAATINKYVEEKTHGKIDQLVEDLDQETLMYLVSYIYYKGKWKTQFNPRHTSEEEFSVDDRTQVLVQMMNVEDQFSVYFDKQISTHVLRLPFNSTYSMLLMLPEMGRNLTQLEEAICPTHYAKWLKGLKKREKWNISLPKFSIKTNIILNDVLRQMGITDVFGAAADLSGISAENSLTVSQVVHRATLDVDESGATAAAVTTADFVLKVMDYVPELSFDRPFMVLIADSSHNILFMGKIVNPNI